jgi:hypothetical protein
MQIIRNEKGEEMPARLWTSTLRRTKETGQFIKQNKLILKYLFSYDRFEDFFYFLNFEILITEMPMETTTNGFKCVREPGII